MVRSAGRDRKKKEAFWRRMVRGQARSGLAVRAWCRRHRLPEASFYWWRRQLARRDAVAPTFLPVQVRTEACATAAAGRIEIVLAGDCRVHVVGPVDRQALADVLAVLAGALGAGAADDLRRPLRDGADDDTRRCMREARGC